MSSASTLRPTKPSLARAPSTGASQRELDIERREPRNLVVLALYDIVVRIGWIFKTESVIMPAFLDAVAGAGWLRGCLLLVNRFGQSVPPLFFAPTLRRMRVKRRALVVWTFLMGLPFLVLAAAWSVVGKNPPWWMAAYFLLMYAFFSCCHGLNQLAYGTLQGKLIGVHRRGRLMAAALPVGSVLAIAFAWWLLGDWLRMPGEGFGYIFCFTGVCFVLASLTAMWVSEPADAPHANAEVLAANDHIVSGSWRVLWHDRRFRRFAVVVAMAATGTILFPHYQALAREQLGLSGANLMVWVVVQNAAVGVFGLIAGWLKDRYGARLAVQLSILGTAAAPILAVIVANLPRETAREWFWTVFIPLGMTPISLKSMMGYTLEISDVHDHPRYLSTMSLCLALPFCLSPLVGWIVDLTSFEVVFCAGACVLLAGWLLSFRLAEPLHRAHPAVHLDQTA